MLPTASTVNPVGKINCAELAGPSAFPTLPVPARVVTNPLGVTLRIL